MKIIFISYYFPPLNSIASFRVSFFAEYLHKIGHDITVISPNWSKDNCIEQSYKTIYTHSADDSVYIDKGNSLKDWIRRKILYKIFAYNNFRDRKPGAFYKNAIKQIGNIDFTNCDVVVSSFGPLDSIHIGKRIKELNPNVKWIIDYRDYYSLFYKDFGIFKRHFKQWEKKLVKTCDGFTTVSETLKENIQNLIGKEGGVVYNGYFDFDIKDDCDFVKKLNEGKPYLSYTGALYHGHRDIRPFLKYYSKNLSSKFRLIFALIDPLDADYVYNELKKYENIECEVLLGISHNQSLLLTKYSRFPILFSDYNKRSNGFLTGKIFEYIYFRKPVIYSGPIIGNELFDLFVTYKWGDSFANFNYENEQLIDLKNIEQFKRENQTEVLLNILTKHLLSK